MDPICSVVCFRDVSENEKLGSGRVGAAAAGKLVDAGDVGRQETFRVQSYCWGLDGPRPQQS